MAKKKSIRKKPPVARRRSASPPSTPPAQRSTNSDLKAPPDDVGSAIRHAGESLGAAHGAQQRRSTDPRAPLTLEEQDIYLDLISKGAAPAAAVLRLGVTIEVVAATLDCDPKFRQRLNQVHETLSQNVAAALYRSAMEGSASAQQFFLKNRPPADWPQVEQPADEASELDDLSDAELIALIQQLSRLAALDG